MGIAKHIAVKKGIFFSKCIQKGGKKRPKESQILYWKSFLKKRK